MKRFKFASFCLIVVFVVLTLIGWLPGKEAIAGREPTDVLEQAWGLAQQSGSYHYRSSVEQTIYPALTVQNAGRDPRVDHLGVEGQTDVLAETMSMTLWPDGSFNPQTGIEAKVENGQTYGRRGQGEWQELENTTDSFAPGGDPLGFLFGAVNIEDGGLRQQTIDDLTLTYQRYTFDLDGMALGNYLVSQTDRYEEKYGPLPAGTKLDTPQSFERLTGHGEIWINELGLPAHLSLFVDMPDQPQIGQRVTASITTDYSRFDLNRLGQATQPFYRDPAGWLAFRLPQLQTAIQQQLLTSQLILLFVLAGFLSLRYWHSRRFYGVVVSMVIVAMLFSPFLRGHYAQAYSGRVEADQQTIQTEQEESQKQQNVQEAVQHLNDNWDAQQNPLAAGQEQATQEAQLTALSTTDQNTILASGNDSDNDGLSDEDEIFWGSCPYLVGTPEYNSSSYCTNVANPTDSDGDGLSDDTEVHYLNTFPTSADTDGDAITDTLEVNGFTYNGRIWYLNPNNEDTNNDGLPDSSECDLFVSGLLNLATSCGDSDQDGIPDFMDADNDGDLVPDKNDLSPMVANPTNYGRQNPFSLTINNLTPSRPVLVDLQLRPQVAEHLQYYNHVLDWPYDDLGQIQRHLGTTWANSSNPDYQSAASNAANGDIRLVPMLEVTIPYTNGHYANLPVNAAYYGTNRTLGVPVEEWLDKEVTEPYGILVDDIDPATGDLLMYVPLNPVLDNHETPVAYSGRVIYQPSQANWGSPQHFRILWLVQMLTDECINPNDNPTTCARQDTFSIIHSYYETWQLTGLNISEQHNLDVALMYENPTLDDNLQTDDQLWGASWNLTNTFMRGRDCESYNNGNCVGNNQRDVTIANLASNLAAWQLDYTQVVVKSYPHQDFITHIMMTETVSILNTIFTPFAAQTRPTILIAQEIHNRVMNLDNFGGNFNNGLTLDMSPANVPLQTLASLSWSSYHFVNGQWQNDDPESYVDYLSKSISLLSFFQPADNSQEAIDQAEGKIVWAQTYYIALLQGGRAVVEINGTAIPQKAKLIADTLYAPLIPPSANWGLNQIAFEFVSMYFSKPISPFAAEVQFAFFGQYDPAEAAKFTNYNRGGAVRTISLLVIGVALVGVALIVAGIITDNDKLVRIGIILMAIVTIIVVLYFIVMAVVAIVTAVIIGGLAFAMAVGQLFQGVGVVGFILQVLITWGVVAFMILSQGLTGVALDTALSVAIAGTIVFIIYLILDLIGLGLIVLIIILIDAIFALLGSDGPTQLLTEAIAKALYGIDMLIKNVDDSDRLNLAMTSFVLADTELGFAVNNSFIYTLTVTNTVSYKDGFSFSTLEDKTVFRYYLEDDEIAHHNDLIQGEMIGEWQSLADRHASTTQLVNITVPLNVIGTGIAESLDGEMFVTESFILPYQGCWKLAGNNVDCSWYKIKDSFHINLGEELVYDILPQTLSEFVGMNWDSRLPLQADQDNDGLLRSSGNDPNDGAYDTDGDSLSDYYEVVHGLNPNDADGDFDGLNDAEELNYQTNVYLADSDGDGLNDYIETTQGWLVTYQSYGVAKLGRVWANPLIPDQDGDTLNDQEEFIFGFHPEVASDRSAISNLVQFNNLDVVEDSHLELLARFDDPAGAETFFDNSGSNIQASCNRALGQCPTTIKGRYGYALNFDGGDSVTTDLPLDVQQFTTAAWIYNKVDDTGYHAIMGYSTTAKYRSPSLYVSQQTRLHGGFGDGTNWNSFSTGNVLSLNTWQHVAMTYDGTAFQVYVNGVNVYTNSNYPGRIPYPNPAYNIGRIDNYFEGDIDEVAIFDRALSPTEIVDLMNGRYNPNDQVLAPSNDLIYRTTVTNTSSTTATGFLSAQSNYFDPAIAYPVAAFDFESEHRLAYFPNSQGEENTALCLDNGSCPTAGVNGRYKNAIQFDGVNDQIILPTLQIADSTSDRFNLSFWLWVDALPPAGQKGMILDTASNENGAMDIYLDSNGKLVINVIGDPYSPRVSNYTFTTGYWAHVSINQIYQLYINATLNTSSTFLIMPLRLGNGSLGNSLDSSQPLQGVIDEFLYYDWALTSSTITSIYNGSYSTQYAPMIFYGFNELINYNGTIFYDSQTASNHATCSGSSCPVLTPANSGYLNRAVVFDGSDDYLTQPGNFTAQEPTLRLYMNPAGYPSAGNVAYLYDTSVVGSGSTLTFDLYMEANGRLTLHYGSGSRTFSTVIPLNQWSKIEIIYDRFSGSGWEYRIYLKVNNVLDPTNISICQSTSETCVRTARVGSGRIANNLAGTAPYQGMLDELSLGIAQISFDPPATNLGYNNLANEIRAAQCANVFICPTITTGYFDQGIGFNGIETYLNLGEIINPGAGKFSAGLWFNASNVNGQPVLLQQTDGTTVGQSWLYLSNSRLTTFLGNTALSGATTIAPNTWHYATITYDGFTLSLYLDGQLEAQAARTIDPSDGAIWLGRHKSDTTRYFAGTIDELIILSNALDPAGIQLLMNTTWPIIDVPDLFQPFSATALTSQQVNSTAYISPNADTSLHQFNQEVEAVLELQGVINYPIVDGKAANLSLFVPFEDSPGSNIFDNLISYPNPNPGTDPNVEAICVANYCPTAGLRGQIDRAAYFDGLDDYLLVDLSPDGYYSWGPDIHSLSVWINAKQGTILDITEGGSYARDVEVDMNRIQTISSGGVVNTTSYTLPRNEWFHLAIAIDTNYVSHIYINGSQVVTGTNRFIDDPALIFIGMNHEGQDFLQGYLDDLRFYNTTLSPTDVQNLYKNSAPLLRFEFDENEEDTIFTDNSVNHYIGQPGQEHCTNLTLNTLTVNNLNTPPSTVFVALDGEWLTSPQSLTNGDQLSPNLTAILCEQQTLSVGVTTGSSSTVLGTVLLDVNAPGTANQTFSNGNNSVTLNWDVDANTYYQSNPAPGAPGRIGNGASFNGNGYIQIDDADNLAALTSGFTIMAWINPTALNNWQYLFATGIQNSTNGYAFLLRNHDLGFATFGIKSYYIANVIEQNVWQHVAVVFDTTYDASFYLNGAYIGKVYGTLPAAVNLDDPLMIGAIRAASGNLGFPPFSGTIDEVAMYGRLLSTAEIYSIYLRELRWYRDRTTNYLSIDTDTPTIELLSDVPYRANGYTQLAVATTDATSYVSLLDFGLKGPTDSTFQWYGALPCQDNAVAGAVWCPSFDTTTLGGEGQYQMQFRAVDSVGNQTISQLYTFYVDASGPTATGNYTGQWGTPIAQNDDQLSWTMNLSGSVNDPNLNTTPPVAGSGVMTSSVLITLQDPAGSALDEESQQATVNGSTWVIDYQMEGARPYGTYTILMTVADQVGNETTLTIGTIQYDERPPQAAFNYWEINRAVISTTTTLNGTVSDQADWGGKLTQLHFEDPAGATTFHDATQEENSGTCTNCPLITTGFHGQGILFDGLNDYVLLPALINPAGDSFTFALWVKPDSVSPSQRILIQQQNGSGLGRSLFYLGNNNRLTSLLGGIASQATTPLAANSWYHVALTFDGTTIRFYLDGILDGSATVTPEAADGNLLLGIHKDLTTTLFKGSMDEVVIYDRVLDQHELYALSQRNAANIQSVEIGLEGFDFANNSQSLNSTPVWQLATVNGNSWSYPLPTVAEGFYNIFLRSTDNFGNMANEGAIWRGLIDTIPPIIAASGQHIGSGSAAQTQYSFTFSDFLLDENSYEQPCSAGLLVSLTYNDPNLPYDSWPYQVTATCQVPGHETSRDFTVCDGVGLCTTLTVTPTIGANNDHVAIVAPADGAVLVASTPVNITGGAYDQNNIAAVAIQVDGTVIAVIIPPSPVVDMPWSTNWNPLLVGNYLITAVMTDTLGGVVTDNIQVTVEEGNPTAISLKLITSRPGPFILWVLRLWFGLLMLNTLLVWRRKNRLTKP